MRGPLAATLLASGAAAQAAVIEHDEEWGEADAEASPASFDPDTQAAGYLSLRVAQDTVQETDAREDAMDLRAQAFARVDHRLSPRLRLHLDGWLDYRLTGERDDGTLVLANGRRYKGEFEATLGEAWIDADVAVLDLRAGNLIVVWGLSDLVNPNDVVNPRDLRRGVFLEPETARLAVPGLRVRAPLGSLVLDALWVPFFHADRVDLFGSDWALFGPGAPAELRAAGDEIERLIDDSVEDRAQPVLLQTEQPDETIENGQGGARALARAGGWDLAAQVFYGWERTPTVELHPDLVDALRAFAETGDETPLLLAIAERGPEAYRAFYRRWLTAGASFGTVLGDLGLTVDAAWTPRREAALGPDEPFRVVDADTTRVSVDSATVHYTVGLEYRYGEDLTLHVEGFHQAMLDAPEDRDLLLGGPNLYGAAALVRYGLLRGDLELRLLAVVEASRGSVIASPEVSWRASDTLALRAGAHVFEGPRASLGGFYDRNDEAYLGARASF